MPTSLKVVGEIYKIVVPIKVAVIKGDVVLLNVMFGVVKSGSKKEGIVTLNTEFSATWTEVNEVLLSVKYGALFGTLIVKLYVLLAPALSVKVRFPVIVEFNRDS